MMATIGTITHPLGLISAVSNNTPDAVRYAETPRPTARCAAHVTITTREMYSESVRT
jgi:hypothetical protein